MTNLELARLLKPYKLHDFSRIVQRDIEQCSTLWAEDRFRAFLRGIKSAKKVQIAYLDKRTPAEAAFDAIEIDTRNVEVLQASKWQAALNRHPALHVAAEAYRNAVKGVSDTDTRRAYNRERNAAILAEGLRCPKRDCP